MDYASEHGGTITWGHDGKLYTVTITGYCFCSKCGPGGAPYRETGKSTTREGAAQALMEFST